MWRKLKMTVICILGRRQWSMTENWICISWKASYVCAVLWCWVHDGRCGILCCAHWFISFPGCRLISIGFCVLQHNCSTCAIVPFMVRPQRSLTIVWCQDKGVLCKLDRGKRVHKPLLLCDVCHACFSSQLRKLALRILTAWGNKICLGSS